MDITLTDAEVFALIDLADEKETPEDTLHRLLSPHVAKTADVRLQRMANEYRNMTAEDQVEVFRVLEAWKASKLG